MKQVKPTFWGGESPTLNCWKKVYSSLPRCRIFIVNFEHIVHNSQQANLVFLLLLGTYIFLGMDFIQLNCLQCEMFLFRIPGYLCLVIAAQKFYLRIITRWTLSSWSIWSIQLRYFRERNKTVVPNGRSSQQTRSILKGILENFATGKHLCRNPFLIKLQASGLQLYKVNLIT